MSRTCIQRLEQVQVGLALLLAVIVLYTFAWSLVLMTRNEEVETMNAPVVTAMQLVNDLQRVKAEFEAPVQTNAFFRPGHYFEILLDATIVQKKLRKYLATHTFSENEKLRPLRPPADDYLQLELELLGRYNSSYGFTAMRHATDVAGKTLIPQINAIEYPPSEDIGVLFLWLNGYLATFATAFLFLAVRVKLMGMRVDVETPRIFVAALVWPYALAKYPKEVDVVEQVRRIKRYIALAITWMLSASPAAFAKAIGGEKTEGEGEGGSNVVQLVEVPQISLSGGIWSRKLIDPGVNVESAAYLWTSTTATWKSGWFVSYWGSRSTGTGVADENDWGFGKAGKFGQYGWSASVTYIDIKPLASTSGIDVIYPVVELNRATPWGTLFVNDAAVLVTGGSASLNGNALGFGLRNHFALAKDLGVDTSIQALRVVGPFGNKSGVVGRFDAGLSWQVTPRFRLTLPALKLFAPLVGAKNRGTEAAIGMNFSYAVN